MNGEEVLRRLWASPASRSIPVAVLSADATARQQQRLLAAGAVAYLTKPLDVSSLLQIVDERLVSWKGAQVSPPANRSMMRLHRLYYVLALFNVITLAASLYLGHEMIEIVKSSAGHLPGHAAAAGAVFRAGPARPGDQRGGQEHLRRRGPRAPRARLQGAARPRSPRRWRPSGARRRACRPHEQRALGASLDEADAAMAEMAGASVEVFGHLRARAPVAAMHGHGQGRSALRPHHQCAA